MTERVLRASRQSTCAAALLATVLAAALGGCAGAAAQRSIADSFEGPDGLIAAEGHPATDGSPWVMTSGSLFRANGSAWSGVPDSGESPGETGSAVFRMVSKDDGFADVDLGLNLRIDDLVDTARTPAQDYDGAHIWVRYQSDRQLYAVSVDRRDATMIIKKKCAGGDTNGGTYYDLDSSVRNAPIPFGQWQRVTVSARDRPDGSVAINAERDGVTIEAIDDGVGCAPLRGPGAVGVRGDNAELRLADIEVVPVSG